MFRFSPFDANPSFSPFILCLYVSFPNSLHSAQRFFSPSSHIVRVNLVFQFSPLYIFIFFPHSCVTKYYVFSRYFSSLHAINFELILFVFFSLIHSTLLRILALSLSHTTLIKSSWTFTFATAMCFLPLPVPLFHLQCSQFLIHSITPFTAFTPSPLLRHTTAPRSSLIHHIHCTEVPIPMINHMQPQLALSQCINAWI